jgi:uncharacterized damage-inducible protein DinB
MTADEARTHLRYTRWASRKVFDAARQLSAEDLTRSTGISHTSILGTLSHIHFADRIWYSRLIDPAEPVLENADLPTLETRWPQIQGKWEAWAAPAADADLQRAIRYSTPDGKLYSTTASQVVLHVVNHATLHRGQIVGMIRQLGIRPPATDFMFHLRELTG